jgi:FkbM family methyltransferase
MTALQKTISEDELKSCIGKDNPIILDIGCNDGSHTLWFLRLFPAATVYSFEPDPRALARFKTLVGNDRRIHLSDIAISDNDGVAEFYQSNGSRDERTLAAFPDGWDLSGSLRPPKLHLEEHPWVTFDSKIHVRTKMLDSWNAGVGLEEIDLIWMDVQGAEGDVFAGGKNTLERTKYVYTEYSNKELYEGQLDLPRIQLALSNFTLVQRYACDVLLKNNRIDSPA